MYLTTKSVIVLARSYFQQVVDIRIQIGIFFRGYGQKLKAMTSKLENDS